MVQQAQSRLRGKKYSGTLYVRKYGSTDGFRKIGNVTELTTSKDADSEKLPSTAREDWGEAIEVESQSGATEISLKFNSFDKYSLAKALMGEMVDLDTTAKDFTDVELKVTSDWLAIGYDDIDTDNFSIKDKNDAEVDVTTYELNPRLGMVRFNDTSDLLVGATIKVTGKTAGRSGYQIEANTLSSLPLEMKLDGKDRITGKDGMLEVPHAVLSADGDIDWYTDDWWEAGLSGALVKDEDKPTMLFKEFD